MNYIQNQTKNSSIFSNQVADSTFFNPINLLRLNNKFKGFKPNLFEYISEIDREFGTNKLYQLKKIFRDLRIPEKFHKNFHVDLWLPYTNPNAGGYYDVDPTSDFHKNIAINPFILMGDPYMLAHVVLHESIHGGYYEEWSEEKQEYVLGAQEMDETITDDRTMKILEKAYPGIETRSGYFDLVREFRSTFKNMKNVDQAELSEIENNSEKLDYYMSRMILGEFEFMKNDLNSFGSSLKNLNFQNIYQYFKVKWPSILKFFDRTVNKIDGNNNLFSEATMYFSRYSLDGVLNLVAKEFIKNVIHKKEFLKFLDEVFKGEKLKDVDDAFKIFSEKGYAYILDFGFENKNEWISIFEGYVDSTQDVLVNSNLFYEF